MPIKRFFDGVSLSEVVLPDPPVPGSDQANSLDSFLSAQNPTGVDPTLLRVDAAGLPDLIPTRGAEVPPTKFAEPLPGDGRGAGVGQPTGHALRDDWANNPDRTLDDKVETRTTGDLGSALPPEIQNAPRSGYSAAADSSNDADTDRKVGGSTASPTPLPGEQPEESWTKAQLGTYIAENGGEVPASNENKDAFLARAQEVAKQKSDLA